MDLIAIKKQIRYQNTHSQGLGGSVAVLWHSTGHYPRDQDLLRIVEFLSGSVLQTKTDQNRHNFCYHDN